MVSQPSTASRRLASRLTAPFRGMLLTRKERPSSLSPNGSWGACTPQGDFPHSIHALHGAPAASDMSEAHRPDPRPYPYLSPFLAFSSHLERVTVRYSGLRGPGSTFPLAGVFSWFKVEKASPLLLATYTLHFFMRNFLSDLRLESIH